MYTKTIVPSLHEQSEGFSDEALTIYCAVDGSALLSVSVRENIRGVSSTTQWVGIYVPQRKWDKSRHKFFL